MFNKTVRWSVLLAFVARLASYASLSDVMNSAIFALGVGLGMWLGRRLWLHSSRFSQA